MNSLCGWCGCELADGDPASHGICDGCMMTAFGVDPATIHAEIEAEQQEVESLQHQGGRKHHGF